jgi:hypothetical protein
MCRSQSEERGGSPGRRCVTVTVIVSMVRVVEVQVFPVGDGVKRLAGSSSVVSYSTRDWVVNGAHTTQSHEKGRGGGRKEERSVMMLKFV